MHTVVGDKARRAKALTSAGLFHPLDQCLSQRTVMARTARIVFVGMVFLYGRLRENDGPVPDRLIHCRVSLVYTGG
jgi:hypothetical protein